MRYVAVALVLVLMVSGCVEQEPTNDRVIVDNVEYMLSNPVVQGLKIPVYYPQVIREKVLQSSRINMVFDCTATEDKPSISVATFNAVSITQNYLVYSHNRFAKFSTYCFSGSSWFNSTNEPVDRPDDADITLLFRGPQSGANETSVLFSYNNTIIIQGVDHRNLTLATDAYSLSVLGVKKKIEG